MDFDENRYKVLKLPNLMLVHWVMNPGLVFNELVLGQRIPKVTLTDKTSDAPLMERQYVPCPHCHTIHSSDAWPKKGMFGNWFGLLCPSCDGIIPCLWNYTSLVLLAMTFPIWGWLRRPLETRWRAFKKKQLLQNIDAEPTKAKDVSWLKMGLAYGTFMFCAMTLIKFITSELNQQDILIQAAIWLLGGLAFGGVMKFLMGRGKST
ncbi:hypothetical protein QWI17_02140 [Gilvimarinus sp. SDUM040013]|uniref:Uncharacterized protein n=1 Tax=Gilvimarinus gilvus TaxID=3058038 RepID=A0ABU4S175_9GAMM|nr:hypothetical protein [Gilvimarinus sp. SDUM040013]MDO3384631.1 hypothetical protein [Gilvimarinus sp. SDUM040013]MDX6850217.1 hypothetical protein [Gilvimarinus sp. SDUM040013]